MVSPSCIAFGPDSNTHTHTHHGPLPFGYQMKHSINSAEAIIEEKQHFFFGSGGFEVKHRIFSRRYVPVK